MDNIYHECGHALFVHLFPEYFQHCEIITDVGILQKVGDEYWEAAIKAKQQNPGTATSDQIDFRIKKIVVAFSGICAQNLLPLSLDEAKELIPNWIKSPDKNMNTYGVSGDFGIVTANLQLVLLETGLEYEVFRERVFTLIFFILTNPIIYVGLKDLADIVYNAQPNTVTCDQITESFLRTGITNYIKEESPLITQLIQENFPYDKWEF